MAACHPGLTPATVRTGGPVPQPALVLTQVLAKSPEHSSTGGPETLTWHSAATHEAALDIADRIGPAGVLAEYPVFWTWVAWAALLHDAGKVAAGFQLQLKRRGQPWRERHEVLSLAYVDLLTDSLPERDRAMIAAGVVFHHRCLDGNGGLSERHPPEAELERKFGTDPEAVPPGRRAR